jgi:hypothetical protein
MKKFNPHIPIMIREAMGVEPKVYARYGMSSVPYIDDRVLISWNGRIWEGKDGASKGYYLDATLSQVFAKSFTDLDDKMIEDKVSELVKAA